MQPDKMEELLMELSKQISSMAKDIEGIKTDMHSNFVRTDENDEAVREFVTERTRAINAELQGQINLLKKSEELQQKQNELYNNQIKALETAIQSVKEERKNKVFSKWEQVSDKIFWIVVAIIFAAVFKYLNFTPPNL